MDRGAWQATVHGVIESDTTEQLSKQVFNIEVEQTQKLFKPDWGFKSLFSKVPVPPLILEHGTVFTTDLANSCHYSSTSIMTQIKSVC